MTTKNDYIQIDASPTKELFVSMLIRDIPLIRAIIDLVDNAVDGALQLRSGNYNGLSIRIELDSVHFKITDNCGGISVNVARDYAFRFGRPKEADSIPGSVGHFGVGMKRAFFKLGRNFKIESTTKNAHFVIEENVDEWQQKPDWHFQFKALDENLANVPEEKLGTIITVTNLHENISNEFKLENFKTRFHLELETAHAINLDKGLVITLNAIPLKVHPFSLLHSEQLQPAFKEIIYSKRISPVRVKIFAGIAERDLSRGGWYIFCNGRMLLEAEQTKITGWGEGNGYVIPKYHADFAYFRGYVFFDSDDAGLLPWTTTKTGVDDDASIYKAVRLEMLTLMRPVLDFLRQLAREKSRKEQGEIDESALENALENAESKKYSEIDTPNKFVAPKPTPLPPSSPEVRWIRYSKPETKVKKVQEILNVDTLKAAGEETFEYFFNMECDE